VKQICRKSTHRLRFCLIMIDSLLKPEQMPKQAIVSARAYEMHIFVTLSNKKILRQVSNFPEINNRIYKMSGRNLFFFHFVVKDYKKNIVSVVAHVQRATSAFVQMLTCFPYILLYLLIAVFSPPIHYLSLHFTLLIDAQSSRFFAKNVIK